MKSFKVADFKAPLKEFDEAGVDVFAEGEAERIGAGEKGERGLVEEADNGVFPALGGG